MARNCKTKGCNRKQMSQSELCTPCLNAIEEASLNNSAAVDFTDDGEVPTTQARNEPPIKLDMNQLFENYKNMADDNPVFKDMFGMMLTIMSRSVENDDSVMEKLNSLSQRLDRLEAKVGRAEDIAVPRSLAVRNLPLPQDGETDGL